MTTNTRILMVAFGAFAALMGLLVWTGAVWTAREGEIGRAELLAHVVRYAETKYAAANGGSFAPRLECLEDPPRCGAASILSSGDRALVRASEEDADYVPLTTPEGLVTGYVYLAAPARRARWWARWSLVPLPPVVCGDQKGNFQRLPAGFRLPVGAKGCPPG